MPKSRRIKLAALKDVKEVMFQSQQLYSKNLSRQYLYTTKAVEEYEGEYEKPGKYFNFHIH